MTDEQVETTVRLLGWSPVKYVYGDGRNLYLLHKGVYVTTINLVGDFARFYLPGLRLENVGWNAAHALLGRNLLDSQWRWE